MALSLNGTTGISGIDGSASAPVLTGTDSNTGINFGNDTVHINTAGSERARVDANGAFHIKSAGTSYTDFTGANDAGLVIGSSSNTNSGVMIRTGTSGTGRLNFGDGDGSSSDRSRGFISYLHSSNNMFFGTDASTRMTILSNGNVGINQTNPQAKFNVTVGSNVNFQVSNTNARVERSFSGGSNLDNDAMWFIDNDSTSGTYIRFWQTVGGAHQIGSISHGTSSTSYNTSSDYRLKENIVSLSDGITRLKTLKPSRFNFIGESETVDGFIAHEVTAVPESVTGTKDEIAETDAPELGLKKGDPIYQGIDQSKLVPLLTAALQEAIAKIEVLETKVAALEAG
jgi:hypothetical protein